jgi:hypothetical protein
MRVLGALLLLGTGAVAAEDLAALRGAEDEALMGADAAEERDLKSAYTPQEAEDADGTVAEGAGNHAVCYTVAATWWNTRVSSATVRLAPLCRCANPTC